ncbi:S-layer homology domain-containing protein [Lysinibacillus fusiformis]|uniref:S-layer homology domain-containing protein n=1 Tax=Lysinibacillus fusiformis TaxID=28031 RepID=UPI001EF466DA|nr:S-layer homology domain-containing protein [Lysinibacillus fusiformis]MCG7435114.1 S-layer homology domain-containing protein [Lysinibacillus fusiformis]
MKALYVFLSSLVFFGFICVSPAAAAEKPIDLYFLDDVDYDHWAYEELERFLYADIIDGYVETESFEEDGEKYDYTYVSIKPKNSITRAEFTKILVNSMNLRAGETVKSFPDVKPAKWYYEYVKVASSQGIINGKPDGTFRPNDKITRNEMAVMIYRAFESTLDFSATGKVFPDVPKGNFAYEAVMKTAALGIIKGYGNIFKPYNDATRAEAIVMIDRALHLVPGADEDPAASIQTVDRYIKDEMKFTEQQDVEALKALYHETTMGYQLAYSLDSMDMAGMIEEDADTKFTMEQIGEHVINAVSVTNHFAEVRIDNLVYKISMTAPDMSFNMNIDLSGTAYLKKNDDGKWKIYNVVLDEDDSDQDWKETLETEIN